MDSTSLYSLKSNPFHGNECFLPKGMNSTGQSKKCQDTDYPCYSRDLPDDRVSISLGSAFRAEPAGSAIKASLAEIAPGKEDKHKKRPVPEGSAREGAQSRHEDSREQPYSRVDLYVKGVESREFLPVELSEYSYSLRKYYSRLLGRITV
ncbi:hypothetical protein [Desulfonatronovibrio hydrogenovorans]|uniref:hypothetical protein n=1 Tax=Desulfonatronovibrio hydrogenovorans TaxID=53245 RepID=UPI00048CA5CA|nr:hypothetical protein [Desulfonatronovibrio hydrogenovorans]